MDAKFIRMSRSRMPPYVTCVVGGNKKYPSDPLIEIFDHRNDLWTPILNCPYRETVSHHCCAAIGSKLYIIGGSQSDNNCMCVDTEDNSWRQSMILNSHSIFMSASTIQDRIYISGGLDIDGGRYSLGDPMRGQWSYFPPTKFTRNKVGATTLNGKLYILGGLITVIGGKKLGQKTNVMEVYDPRTYTWKTLQNMRVKRDSLACVTLNGYIYAIGGSDNDGTRLRTVEKYSPTQQIWIYVKDMLECRSDFPATATDNLIIVMCGFPDSRCVESYNQLTNMWTKMSSMRIPRAYFAACLVPNPYINAIDNEN